MRPPTIIIDGNFIGHYCRFTNSVYHKGAETGVILTFLERVIDLSESYQTNDFVFVWDSKHSYRKKEFPEYKRKRADSKKELTKEEKDLLYCMYRQLDQIQVLFPQLGFVNSVMQNGLEGDDLIAMICKTHKDRKIVIVASDHDLYQCISPNVVMITPSHEFLGREFRVKNFEEKFLIPPSKWHLVKAIGGCQSDEVPGIERVGEITACNYLRGELKQTTKAYMKIVGDEGQKIIARNLSLVQLPHKKTKEIKLKKNEFDFESFKKFCRKMKFNSFLTERIDEWERFFTR